MKSKIIIGLLASTLILTTGCFKRNRNSSGGGGSGGGDTSEYDGKIGVSFYLDYNQITAGVVYETYRIENHKKLTKPADPTEAPLPEFPVFKGWSQKEIIDNDDDLWDFDKDVMDVPEGYRTFNMFGIWVAEGE